MNKEYFDELAQAVQSIFDHADFKDIVRAPPLTIGEGGSVAAYDHSVCKETLKTSEEHTAGGNLFWLNLLYSTMRGIPYNHKSIELASNSLFATPSRCRPLVIALPDAEANVLEQMGAMQCVSPEEELHAWVWAVHRDLKAGKSLKEWKKMALSQPMTFQVISSDDDKYYKTCNMREAAGTTFRLIAHTPYQIVYEVHRFHARMETKLGESISAAKISEMYAAHVKAGTESEPRTVNMIDQCLMIYRRAFADPTIETSLRWCDNAFGHSSPFGSVSVLHAVVSRTRELPKLQWLVNHIVDMVRNGLADASEISARQISGNFGKSKGLADLALMKKQMLDYFLRNWLPNNGFPQEVVNGLTGRIDTHENYRKHYINYPNLPPPDLAWKRGWGNSADLMLQLIDDLVYCCALDATLKTGLKNRKTPEEIVTYGPIQERLTEVLDALKKENSVSVLSDGSQGPAASGASGGSGASGSAAVGATISPGAVCAYAKEDDATMGALEKSRRAHREKQCATLCRAHLGR